MWYLVCVVLYPSVSRTLQAVLGFERKAVWTDGGDQKWNAGDDWKAKPSWNACTKVYHEARRNDVGIPFRRDPVHVAWWERGGHECNRHKAKQQRLGEASTKVGTRGQEANSATKAGATASLVTRMQVASNEKLEKMLKDMSRNFTWDVTTITDSGQSRYQDWDEGWSQGYKGDDTKTRNQRWRPGSETKYVKELFLWWTHNNHRRNEFHETGW